MGGAVSHLFSFLLIFTGPTKVKQKGIYLMVPGEVLAWYRLLGKWLVIDVIVGYDEKVLAFCNPFHFRVFLELGFDIFRRMLPTYEADLADVLAYLLNNQITAVREFSDSCCWNHLIAGCSSASLLYFKIFVPAYFLLRSSNISPSK